MDKVFEALETLKDMLIGNGCNSTINDYVNNLILPIKQALTKKQDLERFTRLVFKKGIDIGWLRQCDDVHSYNYHAEAKPLNEEEFTFIKEMIVKYGK